MLRHASEDKKDQKPKTSASFQMFVSDKLQLLRGLSEADHTAEDTG